MFHGRVILSELVNHFELKFLINKIGGKSLRAVWELWMQQWLSVCTWPKVNNSGIVFSTHTGDSFCLHPALSYLGGLLSYTAWDKTSSYWWIPKAPPLEGSGLNKASGKHHQPEIWDTRKGHRIQYFVLPLGFVLWEWLSNCDFSSCQRHLFTVSTLTGFPYSQDLTLLLPTGVSMTLFSMGWSLWAPRSQPWPSLYPAPVLMRSLSESFESSKLESASM